MIGKVHILVHTLHHFIPTNSLYSIIQIQYWITENKKWEDLAYFHVFAKSLLPKIDIAKVTSSKYSLKKILILPPSYIRRRGVKKQWISNQNYTS